VQNWYFYSVNYDSICGNIGFQTWKIKFSTCEYPLSKVQNEMLKIPISPFTSEKLEFEGANIKYQKCENGNVESNFVVLESDISIFGTRFHTLENPILDFRKTTFDLSLKGLRLELIQI